MAEIKLDPDFNGYRTFSGHIGLALPPADAVAVKDFPRSQFLTAVNQVIARQRLHAWDHEHHRHKGMGPAWHGAAFIVTASHREFTQSNIHLLKALGSRDCAEVNTLRQAYGDGEGIDMRVKELIFMGGPADLSQNLPVLKNEGRHYMPCGPCRHAVYDRSMEDGSTLITILPFNDGSWRILPYDGRPFEALERNQAFTIPVGEFLPEVEIALPDPRGALKKTLADAWEFIRSPGTDIVITPQREADILHGLKGKTGPEVLRELNEMSMLRLRDLFRTSGGEVRRGEIATIRTNENHYFTELAALNGRTTDVNPAIERAVGRTVGFRLHDRGTDAVITLMDYERLPKLLDAWKPDSNVILETPNGGDRERLKKMANIDGQSTDLQGDVLGPHNASVHMILPNNVRDFDSESHVVTRSLKSLLPYGYNNPRLEALRR